MDEEIQPAPLRADLREQGIHGRLVADIELMEDEILDIGCGRPNLGQVRMLARWIVVVVEVVDPDHYVAPAQQRSCGVAPNESGSPGQQDLLHRPLVPD